MSIISVTEHGFRGYESDLSNGVEKFIVSNSE